MSKWGVIARAHSVETGAAPLIDLRSLYAAFATDIADSLINLRTALETGNTQKVQEYASTIHTALALLFPKIEEYYQAGKLDVTSKELGSARRVYEYTFKKRPSFEDTDLFSAARVVLVFLLKAGVLDVFKAKMVGMSEFGGGRE